MLDMLFDNVGEKLKIFAKIVFIIISVLGLLTGIALMDEIGVWSILICLSFIPAYCIAFPLYVLGEIVTLLEAINYNTHETHQKLDDAKK